MQRTERSESRVVRWAGIAAMVAGAAFVLKVTYIFVTDGGASDAVTVPTYVAGYLIPLFAAVGIAAKYASRWFTRLGVWFGVVLVHALSIMVLSDGVEGLINAVADVPGYVGDEAGIALIGLAWLLIGYKLFTGPKEKRFPAPETA
jgi:hypothetical protein